jgi:hypothetical protein
MEERAFEVQLAIERTKAVIDYVKHLTTVSTGSLILVSAFYEKLFPNPAYRILIVAVIVGFLTSILGSVALHTVYAAKFPPWKGAKRFDNTLVTIGIVLTWSGFIAGVLSIGLFVILNAL